ncbi:putative mannitol dehydrogenase [Vitis vinifera]|uniref:Putative mannitol dehydrogenase n=1 Tax=Vitis vinifera TaxID=29760 RepID=A0A438FBG7_VITVI|nr:putative mannitol dehydrogenase [Vitis vinifera]
MAKSAEQEHPTKAFGWAATDTSGVLSPFKFSRRETGEKDVRFKVLYCGICHSDLHMAKNDWGTSTYPIVPGTDLGFSKIPLAFKSPYHETHPNSHLMKHTFNIHENRFGECRHEIVGIVTEVGSKVGKFKVGDRVGVGCIVGACHSCECCDNDLENYCPKMVFTYSAPYHDGTTTYGGYSDVMVAEERYVVRIPDNLPLDAGAPLLCAGITVYSPLQHFGLTKPGMHIGVVGLGGLGHVAVKFAKGFGVKVTVISTSPSKKKEAIEHLGADYFLVSREPDQMQAAVGTMDGIIDTVSSVHPLLPLIGLLKSQGKLVMVGAPNRPLELPVFPLIMGRKVVAGSCIGGMKETQEMIDFAGKHNITADVEVIPMDYVNTAMERLEKDDVRYRFVIDIGNTLKSA